MEKCCQWDKGCKLAPVHTERYCPEHRRMMLRRMEESGYLEPLPSKLEKRKKWQRENVTETKFGEEG